MDPKPEQVAAFGQEARRRRENLGLTTEAVAARVSAILGREVKRQSITQWETRHAPRQWEKVQALDEALGAEGALAALLTGGLADRVSQLEDQMSEVLRLLRQLGT